MDSALDTSTERSRLVRGEAAAWTEYYERIYPAMYSYALRRLSSTDSAQDAVSEALARTVKTIARQNETTASIEAWSFGILRHVVADAQRAMYRPHAADVRTPAEEPDDALVLASDHDSLRAAFALLSDEEREILELRVVARLSSEEVASMLSSTPGAVRMAQSRALVRLRSFYVSQEVS